MSDRVYLDWNATAPLRMAARRAMLEASDLTGNPSSVHADGRAARRLMEAARSRVAALVGAEARNVILTSGGTEANLLALTPALHNGADKGPRDALLVSAIEHASVRAGGRFQVPAVVSVAVTAGGVLDLSDLVRQLDSAVRRGASRPLVSIMAANNETGVVQSIAEAAGIVHAAGGLLHVDAVQAAGRMPINISEMGADLLSLSSHKMGGPQGAGALVLRDETLHIAAPLLTGGGQERGYRAGTENVMAIAGFGAAAAEAAENLAAERAHMARLRDGLEAGLRAIAPGTAIFGETATRLPNTSLFAVAGVKAETALIALDLDGVSVSSGSACSSGKVAPSHVLAAMGVAPALARGAIRVSLGHATEMGDVQRFLEAWRKSLGALVKSETNVAA